MNNNNKKNQQKNSQKTHMDIREKMKQEKYVVFK